MRWGIWKAGRIRIRSRGNEGRTESLLQLVDFERQEYLKTDSKKPSFSKNENDGFCLSSIESL